MQAFDIRQISRDNLRGNWRISILAALLAALLGGLITGSNVSLNIDNDLLHYLPTGLTNILKLYIQFAFWVSILQFIIGGFVQVGYARFLLKQYDNENPEISDLFSMSDHFGRYFLQAFLKSLYIFLWSLLFVIPGLIAAYSYAMTPFILAENPYISANEAIAQSKQIMQGHKAKLFWLDLTFIGWSLLCVMTFGIGNIFLSPYRNAAYTTFYRSIAP